MANCLMLVQCITPGLIIKVIKLFSGKISGLDDLHLKIQLVLAILILMSILNFMLS